MIGFSYNSKSGIYTLSISAQEPLFAKNILENLIKGLDKQRNDINTANTKETRIFIEDRVQETEKNLRIAEEALKVFRDRNRRIENSPSLQLEQERLSREVSVHTSVFITLKQQLWNDVKVIIEEWTGQIFALRSRYHGNALSCQPGLPYGFLITPSLFGLRQQ